MLGLCSIVASSDKRVFPALMSLIFSPFWFDYIIAETVWYPFLATLREFEVCLLQIFSTGMLDWFTTMSSLSLITSLMHCWLRLPRALWEALSALRSRDFTLSKSNVMWLEGFESWPSWDWARNLSALLWLRRSMPNWLLLVRVLLREFDG